MTINLADQVGAFIPYRVPVPPPDVLGVDSEPHVSLCCNETWMSYVLGAAKVLTRPETYVGNEEGVRAAALEAENLFHLDPGCYVPGAVDYGPLNQTVQAVPNDLYVNQDIGATIAENDLRCFQWWMNPDNTGVARLTINFWTDPSLTVPAAARVVVCSAICSTSTLYQVRLQYTRYDDTTFDSGNVNRAYMKNNFGAKEIILQANKEFSASMTIVGSYLYP